MSTFSFTVYVKQASSDIHRAINAGIDAIRHAVPSGTESDSKAIILEKAVEYISHLESLLQDARVRGATDYRRPPSEEESLLQDARVRGSTDCRRPPSGEEIWIKREPE